MYPLIRRMYKGRRERRKDNMEIMEDKTRMMQIILEVLKTFPHVCSTQKFTVRQNRPWEKKKTSLLIRATRIDLSPYFFIFWSQFLWILFSFFRNVFFLEVPEGLTFFFFYEEYALKNKNENYIINFKYVCT